MKSKNTVKTDVAIIGGGAIGSALAYFLLKMSPSLSVTVIERDATYEFASTPRASGGIRRLFSLPENIALSNFSIPFYKRFHEEMATDGFSAEIGFTQGGYLFIVPPSDVGVLKANYDVQLEHGCNVVWLTPDELKHNFPSMHVADLGAAVHSIDDGWLDPHSVLMGLRRKSVELGATFLQENVSAMQRTATRVTAAVTNTSVVEADCFVNAAGAWAKDICLMLNFKIPIEPLRRFEHYFVCQSTIEPLPYIKDTGRLAFRPEGSGYTGGVPTLDEPRGYNFEENHRYFEDVVWPALAHRFPKFESTKCQSTLPGLYDQNDFDGNAIIGPGADGLKNFHMLAGFSGHGLMHAPGCGLAVAELIINGAYETMDLTRLGWGRLLANAPLRERGII